MLLGSVSDFDCPSALLDLFPVVQGDQISVRYSPPSDPSFRMRASLDHIFPIAGPDDHPRPSGRPSPLHDLRAAPHLQAIHAYHLELTCPYVQGRHCGPFLAIPPSRNWQLERNPALGQCLDKRKPWPFMQGSRSCFAFDYLVSCNQTPCDPISCLLLGHVSK